MYGSLHYHEFIDFMNKNNQLSEYVKMLIPEVWQIDGSMNGRKFPYLVKARRIYQYKEYIFYKEILKKIPGVLLPCLTKRKELRN
jgi:hypothetical protein